MSHSTRIQTIQFFEALSPVSRPIADATHEIGEIRFIITRLQLENGVEGEGYMLAFDFSPQAIRGALKDVTELAVGRPAEDTGAFNTACDQAFEYFGQTGLLRWARGLINIAMWDAWGRHLGQPIWKLLGSTTDRVPAYGSGGWLSYSMEELLEEATDYVRRGFQSLKLKVGDPSMERDLERIAKVRECVGPEIQIMIDANQGFDYPSALELAIRARPHGIHWFEEPLVHTDYAGYAALRQNAGLALAMGEREYDLTALRELTGRSALDLWQPDILRLGGVEGWLESAALARAHHLPVLPHYYKEYDVPLACTIPQPYGVESFDWVDGLVDLPVRIENGTATPSPEPGWGFRFRDEHLTPLQ